MNIQTSPKQKLSLGLNSKHTIDQTKYKIFNPNVF